MRERNGDTKPDPREQQTDSRASEQSSLHLLKQLEVPLERLEDVQIVQEAIAQKQEAQGAVEEAEGIVSRPAAVFGHKLES